MQSNRKPTSNKTKQKQKQLQASQQQVQKFEQNIKKKKANIQKKYVKSTVNKLYLFPRTIIKVRSSSNSTSSSSSYQEIQLVYNLKSQNVKSKKNQTKAQECGNFINAGQVKVKQYNSVRSDNSTHSIEQGGKTLKNKSRKSKNIQINFNTKKKNPSQTKDNSQRKLFAEQYSLDNRIYASTKDSTNRFVVSFRDNKKHEINISLSGRKMKTQIN